MKINFRIDWGYQMLYSRRHYHPVYHWDGRLECDKASDLKVSLLEYPAAWWGPCYTAIETPLQKPEWESSTRRRIAGIKVSADCDPESIFKLVTMSGTFEFSAAKIMHDGHFSFPAGPKYGFCTVTVCRENYLWFRPAPASGQLAFEAIDLPLPQRNSQRMDLAELAPGKSVDLDVLLDGQTTPKESLNECLCHLQAMILKPGLPDGQNHIDAEVPMELAVNGKTVCSFKHYFRPHDTTVQMLEDVWARFPQNLGTCKISLKNCHAQFPLCISRLSFEIKTTSHLQMTLPRWALAGEALTGRIFALHEDKADIEFPGGRLKLALATGWNEFSFKLEHAALKVKFHACNGVISEYAFVDEVYALADEKPEMIVGYDMTVVPHDDFGFMDWLLDYTARTQLGNTVVFRSFRPSWINSPVPADSQLSRWGAFCKRHRIYVQSVNCHFSGALQKSAGEYMHNGGKHEYPGVVYAMDPEAGQMSASMKEAYERYIAFLRADNDATKATGVRPAYGDASGGHRHCYIAGTSFIRSETMVPHTQHICSLARPAAEALGQGDWGVHIAIQHPVQLYHKEHHLGQYFLSLFQPWMMGASNIYEEDSLFLLFKEERQCWDDALTKGKRDMTREFFKFVKTHPRQGKAKRSIAFLDGRYAAPFNGFICGTEQDPHYSVWGKFGNSDSSWGHGQPEKCRQLLDVLMPGASTHPLRQRYDKRRFFFSGIPYGDFDQVPIEAKTEYFDQYRLILNLGWNTMLAEDYAKLKSFVANGGTLFTGIPQFSTHVCREFLKEMNDLALWNHGDLSELCGIIVNGKDRAYSGQWNAANREIFITPELSRAPSDSPDEDGPCCLANITLNGAEVVAWDSDCGLPLITRYRLGKGQVYVLCAWAYPGHEYLSSVAAAWLDFLATRHRDDWFVEDSSREVFWNSWRETEDTGKMMLLNTDWTTPDNVKTVVINTPAAKFTANMIERQPKIITILPIATLEPTANIHIEIIQSSAISARLRLHGSGSGNITVHSMKSTKEAAFNFDKTTTLEWELNTN